MRAPQALACVAVSAALLLSACGGSKKDDGKIKDPGTDVSTSAPAPTTTSAAPSPTAAGVKRPTITFPADFKDVFEGGKTGDPVKDAILADNQGYVTAIDDAVIQGSTHTDALEFYSTGKASTNAVEFVNSFLSQGQSLYGTTRYYNREVTMLSKDQAALLYCGDETNAFPKDRKTGKVDRGTSTEDKSRNYVFYNTDLKKNAQGVWVTDNITSIRGYKKCLPQ
ncbi:hypothetical protein [Streptomyces sp. NRRL F-5123]|uniref:hypothetical protein n=1 Tax=Streptomyces sp. NRRL F-5123 TaxID=1463856 RepID=UPI0004E1872A|nr:hypothetical protein [Streptomyces sp. NRRL F-5123]